MSARKPAMTYAELKAKLDAFTPEQLAMSVYWSGEDRGGPIQSVWILGEDWVDFEGEGMEPWSTYAEDPEMKKEGATVYPAGTVILCTDEYVPEEEKK